jgi:hypothetical protein
MRTMFTSITMALGKSFGVLGTDFLTDESAVSVPDEDDRDC